MNNIEDSIAYQIYRISVLKNLQQVRINLHKTNKFLDVCIDCIQRIVIQDLISVQQKEKFTNPKICKFQNEYNSTRNGYAHFFNSNQTIKNISIHDLEDIVQEFHMVIQNKDCNNTKLSYIDDGNIATILTEAFEKIYNNSQN